MALVALGLTAGLGVSELVFRQRDGGAFPQLNVFVADAELGVRLRPGSAERVRFGGPANPATRVRIGADGYRGEARAPGPDDTVVVGDSQVFGLGVEEQETFAAVLEQKLGRGQVLNRGVPTYGPAEYTAVVEEALRAGHPKTIVWTVNLVNDLFERTRPNRERHTVYDGWAVRKEHAPSAPFEFPGRATVLGGSHLVYAFRRAQLTAPSSTPSEGTFADLAAPAAVETAPARGISLDAHRSAVAAYRAARSALDEALASVTSCASGTETFYCVDVAGMKAGTTSVFSPGSEASRSIDVTVEHVRRAALIRSYEADAPDAIVYLEKDPAVKAAGAAHRTARDALRALQSSRSDLRARPSPLTPDFEKVAAEARAHGARLVVLVLPIDVMVSPAEWTKYGKDPKTAPSLEAAQAFVSELAESARDAGAEALDATAILRASEPGAFLDADIHMTPKGHAAVAGALAELLAQPPAARTPRPGLPPGRTSPEGVFPWTEAGLSAAREGTKYVCPTRIKDEWLSFACAGGQSSTLFGTELADGGRGWFFRVRKGGLGEVLPAALQAGYLFAAPVLADQPLEVEILVDATGGHVLRATRDARGRIEVHVGPYEPLAALGDDYDGVTNSGCTDELASGTTGPLDDDCARTYDGDTCEMQMACRRGSPLAPPQCRPGSVAVGATSRCHVRCGVTLPACAAGTTCQEWQGVHACW